MKIEIPNSRQKRLKRASKFLLLLFLFDIAQPSLVFALTSQHQPEFTSYEPTHNTDVVDLLTGDFTYTIPLLEVPSPEGGFSFPLAYHSGIEVDQEASWVGLGWSLNPGAIVRNVREYPDDFDGQSIVSEMHDPGGHGYALNLLLGSYSYDSEKGSGGSIGLGSLGSIGFGTQSGLTILGLNAENSLAQNAVGLGMAMVGLALGGAFSEGATFKANVLGIGEATNVTDGMSAASSAIGIGTALASGAISSSVTNVNNWTTKKRSYFFYSDYEYYLDFTRTNNAYGSLHLERAYDGGYTSGSGPESKNGSSGSSEVAGKFYSANNTSDVTDCSTEIIDNRAWTIAPVHTTYDNYRVMGGSVSGSIQPYRHEIGSHSYPVGGQTQGHRPYFLTKFLDYDYTGTQEVERVPFYYPGEVSNYYLGHQQDPSQALNDPSQIGVNFLDQGTYGTYELLDSKLFRSADNSAHSSFSRTHKLDGLDRDEASQENMAVARGKHVKWFTFEEMGLVSSSSPLKNLIGGYEITDMSGTVYHYKQPVLNTEHIQYDAGDDNDYAYTHIESDYPVMWLLTGITGPDYVDRNLNGELDLSDWGRWVAFEYGKLNNNFGYRSPYSGDSVDDLVTASGLTEDKFFYGERESFYLNSIRTRTHTALFIKEERIDSKGARQEGFWNSDHTKSNVSLKLNDILLYDNERLNETLGSLDDLQSINSYTNGRGDDYSMILDVDDFSTASWETAKENCVKRISFGYETPSNSLCSKTLNSFASADNPPVSGDHENTGKLTLNSVSFYASDDIKLQPDYEFAYGSNPDYDKDHIDAWGLYKDFGEEEVIVHEWDASQQTWNFYFNPLKPKRASGNGDDWCLNTILTPSGSQLEISYERDDFRSISGHAAKRTFKANQTYHAMGKLYFDDVYAFNPIDHFTVGQEIRVHRPMNPNSQATVKSNGESPCDQFVELPFEQHITAVGANWIAIDNPIALNGDNGAAYNEHLCINDASSWNMSKEPEHVFHGGVEISFVEDNMEGGDVRVKEVTSTDLLGKSYTTAYRYTEDGTVNGKSSGVIAQNPRELRTFDHSFYHDYDFPFTPVMYEKVTVLSGYVSDADYLTSQVYHFTTPHYTMVQNSSYQEYDGASSNISNHIHKNYHKVVEVNTSKMGRLESIENYNLEGHLLGSSHYGYVDDGDDRFNDLGTYTDGNLFAEFYNPNYYDSDPDNQGNGENQYLKLFRTTKKYNPNILYSVRHESGQQVKEVTNTEYDLITGAVLETQYKDAFGQLFRTKMTPAHHYYSEMGSKYVNPTSQNMLSQPASEYLYASNGIGWDVVSASVQTWSDDIPYRRLDNANDIYVTVNDPGIWRKHKAYVWKGNLNPDGTYLDSGPSPFEDFEASHFLDQQLPPSKWINTSTVNLVDDYSSPLEVVYIDSRAIGTKKGYGEAFSTSNAVARYMDFAYSGAESEVVSGYFGNEVKKSSSATIYDVNSGGDDEYVHTGSRSIAVSDGEFGLSFDNTEYDASTGYRVGVWVHEDGADDAQLAAHIFDGGNTVTNGYLSASIVDGETKKAGDWYYLELEVPSGEEESSYLSADRIEFKAYNPSGGNAATVYYDDFMIVPTNGQLTCSVYDKESGRTLATLSHQGLATKYDYNDAGQLTRSYQEFFNEPNRTRGFVMTNKYEHNYARE